jgi:hypothetical protein
LLGKLAREKRHKKEVKLTRIGEVVDARVAEADRLALRVRENRDVDVAGDGDTDAGPAERGSELGAGVDVDDDAVLNKGDARVFRIDEACGLVIAAEIVAAVGRIE